jgi:hypothetical protein
LLDLIAGIQVKMVAESEGRPGVPALGPKQITNTENGPVIDYNLLSNPMLTDPVKDFLLPECSSRKELTAAVEKYRSVISEMMKGENIEAYKRLIDPAVFLPGDDNKGSGVSLLSGLHSLELMKNSLLTFESYMLFSLVNN